MVQEFYSNGKLLLTGEYAVLDGATALAIPTKFGQSLTITSIEEPQLTWESFNVDGNCWFRCNLSLPSLDVIATNDTHVAKTLKLILQDVQRRNPNFLVNESGFHAKTKLTFERKWGLGTSSTLIANIAQWGMVDAYGLLGNSFGGSGYDLACASSKTPLLFALEKGKPLSIPVVFNPNFADQLFFVYLNQKQDSREAIKNYRAQSFDKTALIKNISQLTQSILHSKTLVEFENLVLKHELLLSAVLQMPRIQERLFLDYNGVVKSLGGWGGDFVLATGNEKTPDYFLAKGFKTIIPFQDMVL